MTPTVSARLGLNLIASLSVSVLTIVAIAIARVVKGIGRLEIDLDAPRTTPDVGFDPAEVRPIEDSSLSADPFR